MNRKGQTWLTENLNNILIGVICLLLLVGFAYLLWQSQSNKEFKQAKGILENVVYAIEGGASEVDVTTLDTAHWFLAFFPFDKFSLPKDCQSRGWGNCLCICKSSLSQKYSEDCEQVKSAVCLELSSPYSFYSVVGKPTVYDSKGHLCLFCSSEIFWFADTPFKIQINKDTKTITRTWN